MKEDVYCMPVRLMRVYPGVKVLVLFLPQSWIKLKNLENSRNKFRTWKNKSDNQGQHDEKVVKIYNSFITNQGKLMECL